MIDNKNGMLTEQLRAIGAENSFEITVMELKLARIQAELEKRELERRASARRQRERFSRRSVMR